MSEFERSKGNSAWADARELQFPDDFSEEEAAFARQMHELFAVDCEELPPLYVQTLLEGERFRIPNVSFEARVASQVFESLHLSPDTPPPLIKRDAAGHQASRAARRLVTRRPSPMRRLQKVVFSAHEYFRRPVAIAAAVFLLCLALTVVFSSPAFARGLRILLGDTGVVQLKNAPTTTTQAANHQSTSSNASSFDIDFDPSVPLFWLGPVAGSYIYYGTNLQPPTSWSDGAIVDLQYHMLGTNGQGSGVLDIREFRVNPAYSAVLQVVEDGFATGVTLSDGDPAVFVNGMWEQRVLDHIATSIWQTGNRCLLIMERQGVVLWMEADPRDGMNEQMMTSLASQLMAVTSATLTHQYDRRSGVGLAGASLVDSVNYPPGSEVYLLVPAGISPASGVGQFVFSGLGTGSGPGSGSPSSG
jgi:hypothetical protein